MKDMVGLQTFFQTLADVNRLRIIRFIADRDRSVSEIVAATDLSQPLVSHHLRVLRDQSILDTRREGPFVYHKLIDSRILDVLGLCAEIAAAGSGDHRPRTGFRCSARMKKGIDQAR